MRPLALLLVLLALPPLCTMLHACEAESSTLRVVIPACVERINPVAPHSWLEWLLGVLTTDTLMKARPPLYYIFEADPWIAAARPLNKNYTGWLVSLRPGLRWSDGSPVRAEHLVATLEYLRASAEPWRTLLSRLKHIRVLNETAVELNFSAPAPFVKRLLAVTPLLHPAELRLPPERIRWFNLTVGPYVVERFDGRSIVLRRNPYYRVAELRYDRIVFALADSVVGGTQLGASVEGIIGVLDPYSVKDFVIDERFRVAVLPTLSVWALLISPRLPADCRRAVRMSINITALSSGVFNGYVDDLTLKVVRGEPPRRVYTFIPSVMLEPSYRAYLSIVKEHEAAGLAWVFNVEAARSRFEEHGVRELRLAIPSGDPLVERAAESIAEMLRLAGVSVRIIAEPPSAHARRVLEGDYDIALVELPGYMLPVPYYFVVFARELLPPGTISDELLANMVYAENLDPKLLVRAAVALHNECLLVPLFVRCSVEVYLTEALPLSSLSSYASALMPENTLAVVRPERPRFSPLVRWLLTTTHAAIACLLVLLIRKSRRIEVLFETPAWHAG